MPRPLLRLFALATLALSAQTSACAQVVPPKALPDSIADLGALVSQLSEVGGYFDTDNLISNESGYQQVLGAMDRIGVRGGAYIGVGPDQNYTYIARVRPRIVFVVDIRRDNMLEHLLFKALFARAANRAEYLALWAGRPLPANSATYASRPINAIVAWVDSMVPTPESIARAKSVVSAEVAKTGIALTAQDLATVARFHDEFIKDGLSLQFTSQGRSARPYYPTLRQLILEHDASGAQRGYFATEDDFQYIKSLHRRNLIVPVTGDLSGARALPSIGAYLREHGASVSVLYASNVEDYLIRYGRFGGYAAVVKALPRDTNAVMIRSYFGGGYGHPESTSEYYATQILQRMDRFAADIAVGEVRSYRDLTTRDFVPSRKP